MKKQRILNIGLLALVLALFLLASCQLNSPESEELLNDVISAPEINNLEIDAHNPPDLEFSKGIYDYNIYTKTLSISKILQRKSLWCWIACSEIVVEYLKGYDVNQYTLCRRLNGNTDNVTGDSSRCLTEYKMRFDQTSAPISFSEIVNDIDNNQPILADISMHPPSGGFNHEVVIYGYYIVEYPHLRRSTQYVKVWDPNTNQDVDLEYSWYIYDNFVDNNSENFEWYQTRWNIR